MPRDYDDFDLEIGREGEVCVSRVRVPGMGDARHPFAVPFDEGELERLLAGVGVVRRDLRLATGERDILQEIGQRLFAALFGGHVGRFWSACLERARESEKGLRLHLRLRSPELWDWPWEYLYDPDADFLALLPDVSIVRYPEIPLRTERLQVQPPLRVLVAAARPRQCRPVGTEREWDAVKAAWESIASPGRVELELLEGASTTKVKKALRRPFHIFHFIGHGQLETARRRGVLLFEKGSGEADSVTGRELSRILRRQPALRLAVLNACEGARAIREDPFTGVAQQLVHGRIPAVVAMQFRIADEAAIAFSRRFYEALAEGMPVDAAVSEARLELADERFAWEWGNPVLYMRAEDGQIFVLPPAEAEPSPAPSRESKASGGTWRNPLTDRRSWVLSTILVLALAGTLWLQRERPSQARLFTPSDPDCPSPPGLSMSFVKIPPGTFLMGSDDGPADQRPAHRVTITKPFCMGRYEVTQEQWKKVMGKLPRLKVMGPDLPAGNISWNDAQDFVDALNRRDPTAHYSLPTEAQWEYAARAGTEGRFSFGSDPDVLSDYANCRSPARSDGYEDLAPVGSFRKNPWGLYDMYGNASEWVADWLGPYPASPMSDPVGPATGTERVRRGGSFEYKVHCDSIWRTGSKPGIKSEAYGFRVVREPG
ncbi:MAG TPA: SUMF1/EgtB/PvdO family nonheme iron enzyme [Thermoanaerobaculia bacterium]|jgi:formylglycine-generating enzyme required for sulfatase activity|nr:SUMF1/EgtB/PvdO family nonheme iron enzyme [Thermoanaerobaculia bacterium]